MDTFLSCILFFCFIRYKTMKSQTIITIAQKPLINTKFKAFIHCRQFSSFIIEFPLIFTFIYNSFFLHFISFPGLASVSEISKKKKKNLKKNTFEQTTNMSKRSLSYNVYSVNCRLTATDSDTIDPTDHDNDEEGLLLCPAAKRSGTDPLYFLHFYGMSQAPGAALHNYSSANYPLRRIRLIGNCASPPDDFVKIAALLAKYNVGLNISQRHDWVTNTLSTSTKHGLYCALSEPEVVSWSIADDGDETSSSIASSTPSSCCSSDDDDVSVYVDEVHTPSISLELPLQNTQKRAKGPVVVVSPIIQSTIISA